jgi:hypothetical protein
LSGGSPQSRRENLGMIEVLNSPDNVYAIRCIGHCTKEDVRRAYDVLTDRLSRNKTIAVYADLTEFEDITVGAIGEDLRGLVAHIKDLGRYGKKAIVSDREWIRVLCAFWSTIVPRPAIRVFATSEREAALAWAEE